MIAAGAGRPSTRQPASSSECSRAAENELASAEIHHRLQTVSGLRRGRTEAREPDPVKPVPDDQIEAVLKHVSKPVASMIQLQRYTGMRLDEVTSLRLCDIDRSEPVWIYTPASHKTEHHGRQRRIFIGPKGQRILMPYLNCEPRAHLFSPKEAERERLVERHAKRKTRLSCGNRPGTNRRLNPKRMPGDRYTPASYRRAITRACEQAFAPPDHLARKQVEGKKSKRWDNTIVFNHAAGGPAGGVGRGGGLYVTGSTALSVILTGDQGEGTFNSLTGNTADFGDAIFNNKPFNKAGGNDIQAGYVCWGGLDPHPNENPNLIWDFFNDPSRAFVLYFPHVTGSDCEVPPSCGPGEIPDCNGTCAPLSWLGDGICDDGSYYYQGVPIYFNCPQYNNDGGDCDVPSDPIENPPNHDEPQPPPAYDDDPDPPAPTEPRSAAR